jgi:hypothetical protein
MGAFRHVPQKSSGEYRCPNPTKNRYLRLSLNMAVESILWRAFVFSGHEACRLVSQESGWHMEGTAVLSHEGQACRLDYQILCNAAWQTLFANVEGWLGNTVVDIRIKSDTNGHWWLNGAEQPEVTGCTDVDLNFSPSTNLLPIRRVNLGIGQTADVKAAWLRFPTFKLELLPQKYSRLDEYVYRYESAGGQFVADLKVNGAGFVLDYPGLWQAEAASE